MSTNPPNGDNTMPTRPAFLTVTETTLTCSGLRDVPDDIAAAIVEWLHDHCLDEMHISAGTPIVRDPEARQIHWTAGGSTPTQRSTSAVNLGSPADEVWPAPFPQILLQQARPSDCPVCHRPWEDTTPTVLPKENP